MSRLVESDDWLSRPVSQDAERTCWFTSFPLPIIVSSPAEEIVVGMTWTGSALRLCYGDGHVESEPQPTLSYDIAFAKCCRGWAIVEGPRRQNASVDFIVWPGQDVKKDDSIRIVLWDKYIRQVRPFRVN